VEAASKARLCSAVLAALTGIFGLFVGGNKSA
jgi:hypothetical protein